MSEDNFNYIMSHWQIQESLLQHYRSIGVTHQAITAAIATILVSVFENYKTGDSLLTGFDKVPGQNTQAGIVFEVSLLFVAIAYGFVTTGNFKKKSQARENNITFIQTILKWAESGKLRNDLKKLNIEGNVPISIMSELRDSRDPDKIISKYNITKEYLSYIREINRETEKQPRSATRKSFSNSIFDMFYIIWSLILCYAIFLSIKIFDLSIPFNFARRIIGIVYYCQ